VTGRDQSSLAWAEELHRRVAALATAAARAGVEHPDLSGVRERLTRQQALFAQAWVATGMPAPRLTPSPEEVSAAGAALGDLSTEVVGAAARTMVSTLDDVDAMLTAAPAPQATPAQPGPEATLPAAGLPAPAVPALPVAAPGSAPTAPHPPQIRGVAGWPPRKRNGLVYGCFALGVLLVLFATALDDQHPLLIVLSVLVLPFVAWLTAIITILVLFRGSPTGRSTTPKMGLLICLAPNLLLCCGLLGLAGARLLG
jgi:hypothetical protein